MKNLTNGEEDDRALFKGNLLASDAQGEASGTVMPDEFAIIMGQVHYLFKDDDVIDLIKENPALKRLIPALSHMIRTSRIDDPRTQMEMKLRWRRALRLQMLVLGEEANMRSMAAFDALCNFGYAVIEDARNGWRGRLVTERIKTYKFEGTPPKRKKFLGIF